MATAGIPAKNLEGGRPLKNKRLLIYCAGGLGRDVLKMARYINKQDPRWDDIVFVDDYFNGSSMNGAPVWTYDAYLRNEKRAGDEFIIANGETVYRQKIYQKLKEDSHALTTIVHPGVYMDMYDSMEEGSVITEGNILGGSVSLGRCVYVSLACVLGHDVKLEDFVTLSHDVNLSGSVTVGSGTYIGTGAVVRDEVTIGRNCIIGMGSLVTKDIPAGVVAYGTPCRVVRENKDGRVFK